jgi:hypothetical protein
MATTTGSHDRDNAVAVSECMAAYLVHLIWSDTREWDSRRRLGRDEAVALADNLASRLPAGTRARLEALRNRGAAA